VVSVLQQGCFPASMLQSPAIFLQQLHLRLAHLRIGRTGECQGRNPNRKQRQHDNRTTPNHKYTVHFQPNNAAPAFASW
jgi:hypothetical protein